MRNKNFIYSVILFLSVPLMFIFCGQKQNKVEKIIKDGVEVVINHLEPYKIIKEPSNLNLKEKFIIDLERDDLAGLGISEITGFDINSKGNIYVGSYRRLDNFIFKFDENGKYVNSFCHKGQGPGELQELINLRINEQDEILLTNGKRDKLIVLNTLGAPPFQSLSIPWGGPYNVKVKNNQLYCMRGKESGYQELVVYQMKWE